LPGHQPISLYVCTSHNPSENSEPFDPKINTLLRAINACLVVFLFAMYIQIEIFKRKETSLTTWIGNQKSLFLMEIEDKFLASYLMYIVTILNSFITLILILKINSLKPVESNLYPNNLYILFYQLICPLQVAGFGAWAYYRKHGNLISNLLSEVKDNIRFKYFQKI
jgi:hypothetical protein